MRAFSLVELVIVVVIIGIVAAIAVPRMAGASSGASRAALRATLANVRAAMEVYYAEHGAYPGAISAGAPDGESFVGQLTQYTDESGNYHTTYGTPYLFGPYLRAPFPENPFNSLVTVHVKANASDDDPAPGAAGWVAVIANGHFGINASNSDLESVGIDTSKVKVKRLFRDGTTDEF